MDRAKLEPQWMILGLFNYMKQLESLCLHTSPQQVLRALTNQRCRVASIPRMSIKGRFAQPQAWLSSPPRLICI